MTLTEINTKSLQIHLSSIYNTELHVSTYFRLSSGSQFLFSKHIEEGINVLPQYVLNTNFELEDDLKLSKHVVLCNKRNIIVFIQILSWFVFQQHNGVTSFKRNMTLVMKGRSSWFIHLCNLIYGFNSFLSCVILCEVFYCLCNMFRLTIDLKADICEALMYHF
jgi:hypothetical protein